MATLNVNYNHTPLLFYQFLVPSNGKVAEPQLVRGLDQPHPILSHFEQLLAYVKLQISLRVLAAQLHQGESARSSNAYTR